MHAPGLQCDAFHDYAVWILDTRIRYMLEHDTFLLAEAGHSLHCKGMILGKLEFAPAEFFKKRIFIYHKQIVYFHCMLQYLTTID